jgi:N-acetylneuraminate synthase
VADGTIEIGGRRIGPDEPIYVVAELSANHGHDYERAAQLVRAAAEAGADAIKLQTYTAETMTIDSREPPFVIDGTLWAGRTLYDLYEEAHTPWEWHGPLRDLAAEQGVHLFSTPFDASAVDFLEELGVPAYKIASFEIVDLPLLRRIGATGKPVIASTGMASLGEIEEAVTTLRGAGTTELVLLHAVSAYPAPPESMNLSTIPALAETFGTLVGLSDHTLGTAVPVAARMLGACVVEKHFTLARADGGPDAEFSLEPDEFRAMVDALRVAEAARGRVRFGIEAAESESIVFRRSLFVVEDIAAGEPFTDQNTRVIRPGFGLHPRHLDDVLGRRAARDARRGTPLSWSLVGDGDAEEAP